MRQNMKHGREFFVGSPLQFNGHWSHGKITELNKYLGDFPAGHGWECLSTRGKYIETLWKLWRVVNAGSGRNWGIEGPGPFWLIPLVIFRYEWSSYLVRPMSPTDQVIRRLEMFVGALLSLNDWDEYLGVQFEWAHYVDIWWCMYAM